MPPPPEVDELANVRSVCEAPGGLAPPNVQLLTVALPPPICRPPPPRLALMGFEFPLVWLFTKRQFEMVVLFLRPPADKPPPPMFHVSRPPAIVKPDIVKLKSGSSGGFTHNTR